MPDTMGSRPVGPPAPDEVARLFDLLVAEPRERREELLSRACVGRPDLRGELESLLRWETSHLRWSDTEPGATEPAALPDRIGSWELGEPLGRGGMGVVHRARHVQSGALAALKTVRVADAETFQAIRGEIAALAAIQHDGVVRILDTGVLDGTPWYAMELLQGTTLRGRCAGPPSTGPGLVLAGLRSVGRPGLAELLLLTARICDPLGHLHGEGLVHRDLKPENVWIRPDGSPVLMDFGLTARFGGGRERLQGGGLPAGTAAYMSPEQARGEHVDARSDLYALGCILHELVTGAPPFAGASPYLVIARHLYEEPSPPSARVDGIPAGLDRLVLELLAKEPSSRIGFADVVAARLAAIVGAPLPAPRRPRAYLHRAPMEGRAHLAGEILESITARGRDGSGHALVLVGAESGAGKTRLVNEVALAARRRGHRLLMGTCDARGRGPLSALQQPLEAIGDLCRTEGAELLHALREAGVAELAPYARGIALLPGATPALAELPPEAARHRLLERLSEVLDALGRRVPLLLVLDDLQSADDLTLAWLAQLAARGGIARGTLLGTYRTDEEIAALTLLVQQPQVRRHQLPRLDDGAVGRMLAQMLALPEAPAAFGRWLATQAEGNPFYVAEYLRVAVAEGLLSRDAEGRWSLGPEGAEDDARSFAHLPHPAPIDELVRRRIERLPVAARHVLEAAAVLGREVDAEVLRSMTAAEGGERALREAVAARLLEEVDGRRLRFLHGQIRRGAYEAMEPAERARRHSQAAETLIASRPLDDAGTLAEVAHHLDEGGQPGPAAHHHRLAADAAIARYDGRAAEQGWTRSIALDPGSEPSIAARRALADRILQPEGRVAEAERLLREGLALARASSLPAEQTACLRSLGSILAQAGRTEEAERALDDALALARGGPLEASVLALLGRLRQDQGRMPEAEALTRRALAIDGVAGSAQEAALVGNLAVMLREQGRFGEAEACYGRALALHVATGARHAEARVKGNLAYLLQDIGRTAEARRLHEEALRIAREVGDRVLETIVLGNLGVLELHLGRYPEATQLLEEGIALSGRIGNLRSEACLRTNLGIARQTQGRTDEAEALLSRALDLYRSVGDRRWEATVLANIASLEETRGRIDLGRDLREGAIATLLASGDRQDAAELLCHQLLVDLLEGRQDRAMRREGEAARLLEGLELPRLQALLECARAHRALDAGEDARPAIARARALASAEEARPESELLAHVACAERAQAHHDAGGTLVGGRAPDDLTPGQRRWLESRGGGQAPALDQ